MLAQLPRRSYRLISMKFNKANFKPHRATSGEPTELEELKRTGQLEISVDDLTVRRRTSRRVSY
jgi:hypothetical protein